jgi:hypothetical protein
MSFKSNLLNTLINISGWRTDRKIVVIESDDWGSIRMPSKEVYEKLLNAGIRVDKCPYNRYDSLESEEDLIALSDVLIKFKDQYGNHPVFTTNFIVANPDFEKIKSSDFRKYHYELLTDTLKRYPKHQNTFSILKEGINQRLFHPQFHGREHLNINRWMKGLQDGLAETHLAFDNELFGISTTITSEKRRSYMAALDFDDFSELEVQKQILAEGLNLFEQIFGYRSSSFIATNYVWHSDLEPFLFSRGIKFLQGGTNQIHPTGDGSLIKRHSLGSLNDCGQRYLIRNCQFEPSEDLSKPWVESVIKEISNAFFWRKPAIISSHRVNYIGFIDPANRQRNLIMLNTLLRRLTNRWPDIEFMTSDQLGNIIENG